jgi:hypothetical protein
MILLLENVLFVFLYFAGPPEPAYPEVCCGEFRQGESCDVNFDNIIETVIGVPDSYSCQKICQVT